MNVQTKPLIPIEISSEDLKTASSQIKRVLKRVPDLTPNGFITHPSYLGYESPFKPADLLKTDRAVEFILCQHWLKGATLIKSLNCQHTSYRFKHIAERAWGVYVCNGCFIAAAVSLAVPVQRIPNNPNAHLPLSLRWVKAKLEESIAEESRRGCYFAWSWQDLIKPF